MKSGFIKYSCFGIGWKCEHATKSRFDLPVACLKQLDSMWHLEGKNFTFCMGSPGKKQTNS